MKVRSFLGPVLFLAACADPKPCGGRFVAGADGTPICYSDQGRGEPALLFVHGWASDRTFWWQQLTAFSGERRTVSVDLPGHGQSEGERALWSMEAFGGDVAAVVNGLGLERVVLVGHEMGGAVILEAARLLRERVVLLVPVETLFDVDKRLSVEEATRFVAPFREDFPVAARRYVRDAFFTRFSDPILTEMILGEVTSARPEVAASTLEALLAYDHAAALRAVRAPVHIVNADRYPTQIELAQKYAPGVELTLIEDGGHYVMREKPEAFNRALETILTSVD